MSWPGAHRCGLVVVALAVASCGGTSSVPPAAVTTPATATADADAAAPDPVTITAPSGRTIVRASRGDGGLTAALHVSGTAAVGQTIHVRASCTAQQCSRFVFATGDGAWTSTMRVPLAADGPRRFTVAAGYADGPATATARISVRVPRRPTAPLSATGTERTPAPVAATPTATIPAPTTATGTTSRHRLLLIGDSLAVGVEPYLAADLPGWTATIDGRVSRPLATGMAILAATTLPADGATVLAFSLFTNDDPTHVSQLRAAVMESLRRAGSRGCVLWATIVRPPYAGVSYAAANAALTGLARADGRLRLVPWAAAVAAQPSLVGGDGVHPTPAGYALRARLYATAARTCS